MKLAAKTVQDRARNIPGTPNGNPATFEAIRHRSCCQKLRWDSVEAAEQGILRLPVSDEPLHCYYCVFCNDFHLGRGHEGASHTARILEDIEWLLKFDFRAPCSHCGNFNRFNGLSKKAAGFRAKPQVENWTAQEPPAK